MLLGEVAPAAPALGPLLVIAVCLFAFAFVFVVRRLMSALFGWLISALESVPAIGGILAKPFKIAEQAVANSLGAAEQSIDHTIGTSWHLLTRYMDWLWREIRGHAVLLAEITAGIWPLAVAYHAIRNRVHRLTATSTANTARVKTLERELHGIEHQVKHLEREVSQGIGDDVLPRLKHLDRELHRVTHRTIPAIEAADAQAESAISNLYEWAKGKAALLGIGTFATAVSIAIGVDVFNWLRCSSASNLAKRYKCGFWKWIEDALALLATVALAAFSILKPQELAQAAVAAVDEIEPILAKILES